jgi:hypothetical protein
MHIGRGGTGNVAKTEDGAALDLARTRSRVLEKSPSPSGNNTPPPPSGPGGDAAADDVAVPARKPEEMGLVGKALGLVFGKK